MRKAVLTLAGVALLNASAFAGTIGFSNSGSAVTAGTDVVMDISVASADFAGFDTVTIVLGSDAVLSMDVAYAQTFLDTASLPPAAPGPFSIFTTDSSFGGNNFGNWSAPLLVATVRVDTTGLADGDYELFVSSARETNDLGFALTGLASGFNPAEGLEGTGSFSIVPEPATLALLGIGGMVSMIRRRRTA